MDTETVSKFFTPESLATLQGSALACWVVPNYLGKIIKRLNDVGRAVLALLIALVIQGSLVLSVADKDILTWVIALLNAFLIASAASGLNEATTTKTVVIGMAQNPPVPQPSGGGSGQPPQTVPSVRVLDTSVALDPARSTERFSASWFPRRLA